MAGDLRQFAQIYAQHGNEVRRTIEAIRNRYHLHSDDADDVTQLVFLNVMHAVRNGLVLSPGGAGPYLRKVALNAAHDLASKRRRETSLEGTSPSLVDPVVELDQAAPDLYAIRRFTATLAGRMRELYRLRFLEGLSLCEVGRQVGVSRQTIRSIERTLKRDALQALQFGKSKRGARYGVGREPDAR